MRRLLDYDPISGMKTWFEYEQSTDRMLISNEQDASVVNSIVDQNHEMRRDADYSSQGIKNDWWHYARLPNGVILEIKKKHGIDLMDNKTDWKGVLKIINTEYPMLKVTDKTHA